MKKRLIKLFSLLAILFTISFSASAQIYVKIRPPMPVSVIVRPPQPSSVHVWVGEEWRPEGGTYRYSGGYWSNPLHRGYRRTPGHWSHGRHGDSWHRGGWRKD